MGVYLVELSALDTIPPARTSVEQATFDAVYADPVPYLAVPGADMDAIYSDPYGAGGGGAYNAQTLNRAWHTISAQWVYWRTADPDPTGASYPGPGTFGECTNYGVESIVYVSA